LRHLEAALDRLDIGRTVFLFRDGDDEMSNAGDFLEGATIESGPTVPVNDSYRDLFGLNTSSASYWFTAGLKFSEDGNTYSMLIGDFGALGRDSLLYKSFSADEIYEIRKFLESYFSSRDVPYFCATVKNVRPSSLQYRDPWIIEGNGELYNLSNGEFRPVTSNA
jgi:hypothetical protein